MPYPVERLQACENQWANKADLCEVECKQMLGDSLEYEICARDCEIAKLRGTLECYTLPTGTTSYQSHANRNYRKLNNDCIIECSTGNVSIGQIGDCVRRRCGGWGLEDDDGCESICQGAPQRQRDNCSRACLDSFKDKSPKKFTFGTAARRANQSKARNWLRRQGSDRPGCVRECFALNSDGTSRDQCVLGCGGWDCQFSCCEHTCATLSGRDRDSCSSMCKSRCRSQPYCD